MGSLALLMLHRLAGGAWGILIRRPLEAGALTIPVLFVLFIPILIDLDRIYPWVNDPIEATAPEGGNPAIASALSTKGEPEAKGSPVVVTKAGAGPGATGLRRDPLAVDTADMFAFKKAWLNPRAFTIRVAIYFALWITLALVLNIGSARQDATRSEGLAYALQGLSAPGLVIYFLSVSFAVIDWGMSLEPEWYSSLYGVLVIIGQGISTMALMIGVTAVIARRQETEGLATPETFNDLGNLLLAFTMLWAYLSFSQFLIIYSGNLSEEIPWYVRRLHNGWGWINFGRFLMVFHFFVPFLILLARPVKRRIDRLWKVAALVLFAHLIDAYWLIAPSFGKEPGPYQFHWLDLIAPVALGGVWLAAFLTFLKAKPIQLTYDPELFPALKQAAGAH
jgi:hypothetical protein